MQGVDGTLTTFHEELGMSEITDDIRGHETFVQATKCLEAILGAHPRLRELVQSSTIGHKENKSGNIYLCPQCRVGWLHAAGRNLLPDGNPGLETLFVCDACGHYESRRY